MSQNFHCFLCCTYAKSSSRRTRTAGFSPLKNNLNAVFLLRNLLQVPSIHLESQLQNNGDNPEKWVQLCNQCIQLTRKARILNQEIKKIEREFRSIQKQVLEKITNSTEPEPDNETVNLFGKKIRSFVKRTDHGFLNDDNDNLGFLEGDKLAKYLETQQVSRTTLIFVKKSYEEAEIKDEVLSPPPPPPPYSEAEDAESSSEEETTVENEVTSEKKEVVKDQVFLCDHCGKEFNNEVLMKMHAMKEHKVATISGSPQRKLGSPRGIICCLCGKSFGLNRELHLHRHLINKHKDDPVTKKLQEETGLFYRKCKVVGCNAAFMKQSLEDKHMATVHSGGNNEVEMRPHKCRFCGRGFWIKNKCWRHERIHEVKGKVRHNTKWKPSKVESGQQDICLDKRFKCVECGKSWDLVYNWSGHIWKEHGIRDIICPGLECEMVFKGDLNGFRDHWRTTHLKEKKKYDGGNKKLTCEICGEEKSSFMALYHHRKRVHKVGRQEEAEEKCPKCGKTFSFKHNLVKHVKIVHDKVFDVHCPLCGLGAQSLEKMKRHLLAMHKEDPAAKLLEKEEGIKLLICGVGGCRTQFLKQEFLDKHREKRHAGKK